MNIQAKLIKKPSEISRIIKRLKAKGKRIGFVPTMGYLHDGHISLIRKARRENDIVIVSIFVNPIQFGPGEDYKKYPRNIRRDIMLAKKAGCDIIFYPGAKSIYPPGYATYVDVKKITSVMCGKSRSGHFEGVATVCAKLFNIIRPDTAYFGGKDYQQALVIRKMAQDLNMGIKIKGLPIVREKNGLAMSSRNKYLTPVQRANAAVLYKSLLKAKELIKAGQKNVFRIKQAMRQMILKKPGIRIDYIAVADPDTLKDKKRIDSKVLVALAAYVGKTRLIDNMII